jgi:hypothetical protein
MPLLIVILHEVGHRPTQRHTEDVPRKIAVLSRPLVDTSNDAVVSLEGLWMDC